MQSNSPRTRQDLGLHEKPQNVAEGAAEMGKHSSVSLCVTSQTLGESQR